MSAAIEDLSQVRAIIQKRVRRGLVLADDAALYSSGVLDSMGIIELITELEETFSVAIPGTEVQPDDFDSIAKILTTVQRFRG